MDILIVGCGKMGGALLSGWVKGDEQFTIVDPALEKTLDGVRLVRERDDLGEARFDAIIVAIKPQLIDKVMPGYDALLAEGGYVLSIAAGASISRLATAMGGAPVIRVMPNLPAAIGKGVSGICASAEVGEAHLAHARKMMERNGTVIEVDDEDALDRFTAIAGSGPGYVFELARTYVMAAMELGFAEAEARAMVLGTLEGTIAMAKESDSPLEELRNSVTSKGGTTAAGLDALNGADELTQLLSRTAQAAYTRAVELR
jgi:pyrroline-5-carboxylate reductase